MKNKSALPAFYLVQIRGVRGESSFTHIQKDDSRCSMATIVHPIILEMKTMAFFKREKGNLKFFVLF